ncbi:hypothetical protein NONO_c29930 [Nocardia nova SH22a]|uniref:Uncharacterized protein n=1 Tax=Nocardia nova SH22a TaxID=1415166 RepID=W5TEL6_9NOCA|nr:hypothetical protein NONO_c29930 [Nocardia nova SH22a]
MPSWWPLHLTWHGLPAPVPVGCISYFVLPAVAGAVPGRRFSARFAWRRPQTLLTAGLVVGFVWAFLFNAIPGARLGVFHYGRVIPGLALWEGTKYQYPLYDVLAMGVQMMVFTYLLGRPDAQGRTVIDMWADALSRTRVGDRRSHRATVPRSARPTPSRHTNPAPPEGGAGSSGRHPVSRVVPTLQPEPARR